MKKLTPEDLIEDRRPRLPAGMVLNLYRAQNAISLIAAITHQHAQTTGIHADHICALASYISDDMDSMLTELDGCEDL